VYFLIYIACGFYLWLLGVAVFGGCETRRSLFHAPWLGYAVLIGCLQILHFFLPLSPKISWMFLVLSSLSAVLVAGLRLRRLAREDGRPRRLSMPVQLAVILGVGLVVFFPVFNTTTQAIVHYDSGYYYLQTIRWTTTFPIVPGLGNLFLNLAFNQSAFLVASFFDSLGPHLWGYSLLGGVLPWIGLSLSIISLLQGFGALLELRGRLEPIEKAYLISLPAWVYTLLTANISSNSPDIPSACLQIHLFLGLASFLAAKEEKAIRGELSVLIILAALSLSIKLSSLFFATSVTAVALVVAVRSYGLQILKSRQVFVAGLMAVVLFVFWFSRGIVSSGYPFFPSSALGVPVAWRVPPAVVSRFYDITMYWARQPYFDDVAKVRSGFAWVPEWLQRNWKMKDQFERPLVLSAVWISLLVILAWRRKDLRLNVVRMLILIMPVAVSLAMWFLTAPDPRYLGSITWFLPLAVPLCLISETSLLSSGIIGLSLCLNYAALGTLRYNTQWAWKKPAPGFPEIRAVETREGVNLFGVRLYHPKKGDQLFDAPLPSSRDMQPFVMLLDETKGISGGFRDSRVDDGGTER
jgi:hypothetical protein